MSTHLSDITAGPLWRAVLSYSPMGGAWVDFVLSLSQHSCAAELLIRAFGKVAGLFYSDVWQLFKSVSSIYAIVVSAVYIT